MSTVGWLFRGAFAAYVVALAYVVWSPGPVGPSWAVNTLVDLTARLGTAVPANWVEFGLNIVLFVPLGLLGLLTFRRTTVSQWAMLGYLASVLVEFVQRTMLPTRSGEARDVVSNTFGALLGALVAFMLLVISGRARRPGQEGTGTALRRPASGA